MTGVRLPLEDLQAIFDFTADRWHEHVYDADATDAEHMVGLLFALLAHIEYLDPEVPY